MLLRRRCTLTELAVFSSFFFASASSSQQKFSLSHDRGGHHLLVRVEQGRFARFDELRSGCKLEFSSIQRHDFVPTDPFVLYVWLQISQSYVRTPAVIKKKWFHRRLSGLLSAGLPLTGFDVKPSSIYYSDGCTKPGAWKYVQLSFKMIVPWLCIGSAVQPEQAFIGPTPLPKRGRYTNIPETVFHCHVP